MLGDRLKGASRMWYKPGYYGIIKFGTLTNDGTALARPTRPWRSDHSYGGEAGNIPARTGTNMNNYQITNSSANDDQVLRWHIFIDGKRYMYICDRVLVSGCSFNHLNSSNLVTGKFMHIDGRNYWCRILTGGVARREGTAGTTSYSGGYVPNEWDRLVMNGYGITGVTPPYFVNAPQPETTDYDVTTPLHDNNTVRLADHNQAWNWISMYSWIQDIYAHGRESATRRGYNSARYWATMDPASSNTFTGWRPVLLY